MKDKPLTACMCGFVFDVVIQDDRTNQDSACSFWWPTSPRSKYSRPCLQVNTSGEWHSIVKGLIHELFEAATMEYRCLFEPTTWMTDTSAGRHILHMNHAQFTEISDAVGDVVAYLLPEIAARRGHKFDKPKRRKE